MIVHDGSFGMANKYNNNYTSSSRINCWDKNDLHRLKMHYGTFRILMLLKFSRVAVNFSQVGKQQYSAQRMLLWLSVL